MDERERRKQRRRKEAMRGRILAGVFLLVLAEPMLEKLDRIKVKYGLVE